MFEPAAELNPTFPVRAVLAGVASVIAVSPKITKLLVCIDKRFIAGGPAACTEATDKPSVNTIANKTFETVLNIFIYLYF